MDEQAFDDRLNAAVARAKAQSERVKRNNASLKQTLSGERALPLLQDDSEPSKNGGSLNATLCLDRAQFNDRMADSKSFDMVGMKARIQAAVEDPVTAPANGNGCSHEALDEDTADDDTKRFTTQGAAD